MPRLDPHGVDTGEELTELPRQLGAAFRAGFAPLMSPFVRWERCRFVPSESRGSDAHGTDFTRPTCQLGDGRSLVHSLYRLNVIASRQDSSARWWHKRTRGHRSIQLGAPNNRLLLPISGADRLVERPT